MSPPHPTPPPQHQLTVVIETPTFGYLLQSENVGLCQLSPTGRLLLLLIFQNQGFDRLSEFPKIREAIIVSADGCGGAVDLKLYMGDDGEKDCMASILAS